MRTLLLAFATFAVAACGQTVTPAGAPTAPAAETPAAAQTAAEATAQDICGASQYGSLIGANLAAVTLPADANIRVIQPDTPVTDDFRPDRLNIIVDANGVITSLECY